MIEPEVFPEVGDIIRIKPIVSLGNKEEWEEHFVIGRKCERRKCYLYLTHNTTLIFQEGAWNYKWGDLVDIKIIKKNSLPIPQ